MDELEIIHYPQIDGLSIFFDTVDYRTPHSHPELELVLILDQPLAVDCGGRRYRAEPGDMVLFPPDQPHAFQRLEGPCTFLCLQLTQELFARACPDLPRIRFDALFPGRCLPLEEERAVKRDLWEMLHEYLLQAPGYELFCAGKTALLLYRLIRATPHHVMSREETASRDKQNARFLRLIDYVNQNYMHSLRLADFAAREGLSPNYLSGLIKQTMNQSFQEYVNTVRFHAACQLIDKGEDSLIGVCEAAGFSDYRYFSRTFQTRLGMTPAQYRDRNTYRQDRTAAHRSAHSSERFYTRGESLILWKKFNASAE